jgi:uncharacterized protein (TIGR02217 family)
MAFDETRLPTRLAFGSTGGVERRTEVVTLASGFERRSTPWAHGRRRYLIGAGLRSLDDMAGLTAFFEARRGRLRGFRFRDFTDFRSCAPGAAIRPVDQTLGAGDGTRRRFQLTKAYGDVVREIRKPVEGAVSVAVDGVTLAAGAFVVEATTGEVELATAPGPGAVVSAGFEFDTPVRFDADRIEITLEGFGAGRLVAVPLIEVRV